MDNALFTEKLMAWHATHARDLIWCGEKDPYKIWISEIMLQQTRTETVDGYYRRFLSAYPTVRALAEAPLPDVLKQWEGLGYYSRARNLHKAAGMIMEKYGGRLPDTVEELRALPGIGDYTAGAIASIAYGRRAPAVDGNLNRVMARVLREGREVHTSAARKAIYRAVYDRMPEDRPGDFNQALMGLGNLVCKPINPDCAQCPVRAECGACRAGEQDRYPVLPPRPEKKNVRLGVALLFCAGRVLVRRRPEDALLGGLWEFPHFEGAWDAESMEECLREAGFAARHIRPAGEKNHVFTHLVWQMRAFTCQGSGTPQEGWRLAGPEELRALAMPTAMKAWRTLAARMLEDQDQ